MLSEALPEGGRVALSLILTQDGIEDPNEEPFETQAQVMWCAPLETGGSMNGLRFVEVTPEQRKRLQRFLALVSES